MTQMTLWELKPREDLPELQYSGGSSPEGNPWVPWYDKAFGFLIAAPTEIRAREIADEHAGDENEEERRPWLDPNFSTCVPLHIPEDEAVIMRDFHSA